MQSLTAPAAPATSAALAARPDTGAHGLRPAPAGLHFEAIMQRLVHSGWQLATLAQVLPELIRRLPDASLPARSTWLDALQRHWPQLERHLRAGMDRGPCQRPELHQDQDPDRDLDLQLNPGPDQDQDQDQDPQQDQDPDPDPDPDPDGVAWMLGVLGGAMQCWRQAATCFALSLAARGPHQAIWHNLAIAHWQLGEYEAAEQYMRRASAAAAGNTACRRQLATMRAWRSTCRALLGGDRLLAYPAHADVARGALHATLLGIHHAGALLRQQDDPALQRLARLQRLHTLGDARAWIAEELAVPGKIVLALMHPEHGLAGVAALECDGDAATFYYWLGRAYQGQGGGRTALRLLKRLALRQGIRYLYSPVLDENRRSLALLRRAGYRQLPGVVEEGAVPAPYYGLTLAGSATLDDDGHFARLSRLLRATGGQAASRAGPAMPARGTP